MIERVIVGIDFSEGSRAALLEGEDLAEQFGVPCLAVHVLPSGGPLFPEALPVHMDPLWYQAEDLERLEHLQEWVSPLPQAIAKVVTGEPADQLVRTADPNALLVLGREHHSPIGALFAGSTTRWILNHAPCPVMVVPASPAQPGKE
ncbi:MAG: universal stress protein [Acidobacteria bacterium]|nr:universal stress protein [Acidobacteriota bacterium]